MDESYVVLSVYFNDQNERSYGKRFDLIADFKRCRLVPKSPLRAMVFVAMWPAGRFEFVILPTGFKATSVTYIKSCLEPLLKSLPAEADRKKMILDQDLAPAYRAKKTQVFLRSILPSFVPASETPPNIQDLHPLDYCLWSVLKV